MEAIKGLINGLHHVTATVNDAQEDYDFYTKILGMRLVKQTVNFENEKVYHFYYGNEIGSPSTIFTTFPYKGQRVRQGQIGTGQVAKTGFSIPVGATPFWKKHLEEYRIRCTETQVLNLPILEFKDPSGLQLYLFESEDDRQPVWASNDISLAHAIRGIHSVWLLVEEALAPLDFLKAFGYEIVQAASGLTQLETVEKGAGNTLFLQEDPMAERGVNGIGTVHHVAHRVQKVDDNLRIKEYAESLGLRVTEVKDRKYFKSIYFRIPGGVLFEVATIGPGFLVDEEKDQLGTSLKLPDWQEPDRAKIEENLRPYNR